jgi:tetratricopeptide (TPR) repeat protein
MALTYWGWDGNRDVVGKAVKPSDKDRNVMPYEFQAFIDENVAGMSAIIRQGGDVETIKRLVSAGFPVVAEKGYYERDFTGKVGWMGHYQFITGYDDKTRELIVQDTYNDGPNFHIGYEEFMEGWRSFNYLFAVIYPVERESEVLSLLGGLANEEDAARHALEIAKVESKSLGGIDRYFAWFNIGTSHIALRQYVDAAMAYDQAFAVYANLASDDTTRPYRMLWYQTGPYWAYYYSGRYADVINLANTTLKDTISEPVLEESLLWRGRAYYMAGDTPSAVNDYRAALKVHPLWAPALQALQDLGVQP